MVLNLTSPQEFFHNELKSALETSKITLSSDLEFYVVNLLCGFIVPENLNLSDGEYSPLNTPLAILFEKAVEAPLEERLKILKSVGDTSLYVSGFFQDYFRRKTFSLDYFVSVGVSAYTNVSNISKSVSKNRNDSKLYGTLAEQFTGIVDVVASMSDKLGEPKHTDILAIYERWVENKSHRLLKKLKEHGIIPIASSSKSKQ